ncbi:MAG: IPT/TIG domain-containing protein, partial [Terracidiphilus sp.]
MNRKSCTASLISTILVVLTIFCTASVVRAATPTITSLTPNSGAVGASVTIAGTNFGSTQGTSTVKFNGA